ncbi:MAG: PhoH family protein [Planctomycetaceae bacterium]|nr:PhoH family protein [Planctomycetales bacterium]MCB9924158.1 PhoH family protein [Planctomycetaceae bacterium]
MTQQRAFHRPKLFVLDTNVILHDSRCIYSFDEHDIAIPITVLEELDQFKKGHGDLNYQARAFLRSLDELTGDLLSPDGVPLGESLATLRVILEERSHERVQRVFLNDTPDHRILNAALHLQSNEPEREVIFVSKDTNLRMKAKAVGLCAQDYTTDMVASEQLYTGHRLVDADDQLVDKFYGEGQFTAATEVPELTQPVANEGFVVRNGSKSAMITYDARQAGFSRLEKMKCYGVKPRNAEQSFALNALTNIDIKLVTLTGKAGTGKTLLALAAALHCQEDFRQILLARPVVPLSNRDMGFLPGNIGAKLDPYIQPLFDNLAVIRNQFSKKDAQAQQIERMLKNEELLIAPLAYIRGRSLQRTFFIVDEAQNLTPHEVKTIITRAGEGTKIVLTGDVHQIDHPYLDSRSNGLTFLINRMVGQPTYAHVTLAKGERSALADLASELL